MTMHTQKGGKYTKWIDDTLHAVSAQQLLNLPFEDTVHVRDMEGKLHELKGDVDMGSYCSIIQ